MKKFFRSLLAKYMLLIILAISLVQIIYLMLAIVISFTGTTAKQSDIPDETAVESKWHDEVNDLEDSSQMIPLFERWQKEFPEAAFFWVDDKGALRESINIHSELPQLWTPSITAKYIKDRYNGDPFTVIAFIGNDVEKGFAVIEIPRSSFDPVIIQIYDHFGNILLIGTALVVVLFVLVSFLFFRNIRKRLLQLQEAMKVRDVDGLPIQITVKKKDEIGNLEESFNEMVDELRESRKREQEEEQLRRELIANLSHDLRTPLTKIRAQTYSLEKEELSDNGKKALRALESSIVDVDRLIENLMSYTLLMANKFNYKPQEIDIIRLVRECTASWYEVFENKQFEINVDLTSFQENKWFIDPIWFSRILDNLLQNVLRHANSGKYICVCTESTDTYDAIIVSDRGKGMNSNSDAKGAGIGLSIVDLMVKSMSLDWSIHTNDAGTTIKIMKHKR